MTKRQRARFGIAALLLALAIAGAWWSWKASAPPADRPTIGLVTSLPIYWPEEANLAMVIDGSGEVPWIREHLEERYQLVPLDSTAPDQTLPDATDPLAGIDFMLIVQPRSMGSADNVAIDQWVRDGGHLLYALDPMLTGRYAVPWGDPAHPIVTALIPPIFTRWGLGVQFSEAQPFEMREVTYPGGQLPVMMAGEFLLLQSPDDATNEDIAARGECELHAEGIVARCKVGAGQVTAIVDAALFEFPERKGKIAKRLDALVDYAF